MKFRACRSCEATDFKTLTKNDNTSAITDHVKTTGHNIKWDHFQLIFWRRAKQTTIEIFFIQELEPAFNVYVRSQKLNALLLTVSTLHTDSSLYS